MSVDFLFLYYEQANFPTIEKLLRRHKDRSLFVKGFDYKEFTGVLAPWVPPGDLPWIEAPDVASSRVPSMGNFTLADSLATQLLSDMLVQPWFSELYGIWAKWAAKTEKLLKEIHPKLVLLPEDTDYIRGRLAASIARKLGLKTVVISAHYYDRFENYPLIGERLADYYLVLNELRAKRLRKAGVDGKRIFVVGNDALTQPRNSNSGGKILICDQGLSTSTVWRKDIENWAKTRGQDCVWFRAHPSVDFFETELPLAPSLPLEQLWSQVNVVIAETSAALWQATSAGIPVIVPHYEFGPLTISLSTTSVVVRTRKELWQCLDKGLQGKLRPLSAVEMVSQGDPVESISRVLDQLVKD